MFVRKGYSLRTPEKSTDDETRFEKINLFPMTTYLEFLWKSVQTCFLGCRKRICPRKLTMMNRFYFLATYAFLWKLVKNCFLRHRFHDERGWFCRTSWIFVKIGESKPVQFWKYSRIIVKIGIPLFFHMLNINFDHENYRKWTSSSIFSSKFGWKIMVLVKTGE